MDIKAATKEGREAFERGAKRAPALNQKFLKAAAESAKLARGRSAVSLSPLLEAYLAGWDAANLARPVWRVQGEALGGDR